MNRNTIILAIVAFILVAAATPFQLAGIPLAPLAALVVGAAAGWWLVSARAPNAVGSGARAGAVVGIGALLGAIFGLAVLGIVAGNVPAIQDWIRASEPYPDARIPIDLIAPLATVGGILIGLALGLFDLLLSALAGSLAGLLHTRTQPTNA
jgi:hypothetical protein